MYWKLSILMFVFAFLIAAFIDMFFFMGYHVRSFQHHPGSCKRIDGSYVGSEDFQILTNGLIFISSGIATKYYSSSFWEFVKNNDAKGQILMMDLRVSDSIKELKIRLTKRSNSRSRSRQFDLSTFRPHGLSVLEDKVRGEHLIYVVNHNVRSHLDRGKDSIEKFKYHPETEDLEHISTFSSSMFQNINDLAVTGEDTFYVTNDAYSSNKVLASIEIAFRFPIHYLLYYNGTDFTFAAKRLSGPNGITISKDGKHVYVAMFLTKGIKVYERLTDGSLKLVQEFNLGTSLDNFHLSEDGSALFSGSHPVLAKLAAHIENPTKRAPSQVLRFPLKNGLIMEDNISELFYDNGDLITASTVGTVYKDRLYIGSLLGTLVICDLPKQCENPIVK